MGSPCCSIPCGSCTSAPASPPVGAPLLLRGWAALGGVLTPCVPVPTCFQACALSFQPHTLPMPVPAPSPSPTLAPTPARPGASPAGAAALLFLLSPTPRPITLPGSLRSGTFPLVSRGLGAAAAPWLWDERFSGCEAAASRGEERGGVRWDISLQGKSAFPGPWSLPRCA